MGAHIYLYQKGHFEMDAPWLRVPMAAELDRAVVGRDAALSVLADLRAQRWPCPAIGGKFACDAPRQVRDRAYRCCDTPCVNAYRFTEGPASDTLDEIESLVASNEQFESLEIG